jgi:MFS family permease
METGVQRPGGGPAAGSGPILAWRRNLAALTAASFIGFTGFTLVMPFLPLYIAELGVRDVGAIALWTGFTLGVTPAITALLAPAWGRLADRFGRKLLVARSLASFVVIMAAMAWVTQPWHLFALRALQGLFAGYGPLCLAMAAESSPRDRVAQSIGMVQTAQRLGPALGPVLGGAVAALVGLRAAFLVTSAFYVIALVQLLVLYQEPPVEHPAATGAPPRVTFGNVLAFENFLLLMAAIFGLQFVDRSFGPVLPLHVAAIGVAPARVAFVSGVVFSALACSAAAGHHLCARLLRRWSARDVISSAALVSAGAVALFVVLGDAWALVLAAAVFGGSIGAAMTAAYAAAAGGLPSNARGAGFGFLSSASLTGVALSPVACGFLAATDIRIVFATDAFALCLVAVLVRRVMIEHPRVTEMPVVGDS